MKKLIMETKDGVLSEVISELSEKYYQAIDAMVLMIVRRSVPGNPPKGSVMELAEWLKSKNVSVEWESVPPLANVLYRVVRGDKELGRFRAEIKVNGFEVYEEKKS